jgi:hypothetical protein
VYLKDPTDDSVCEVGLFSPKEALSSAPEGKVFSMMSG